MKTLDKGNDKIQKICDSLRRETIEPAQKEAEGIIAQAQEKAGQIIKNAEIESQKIIKNARDEVEKERNVFHSSLSQAASQSLEILRQEVEENLFNEELDRSLKEVTSKPEIVAELIQAVVKALEKEGISAPLEAIIPKQIPGEEIAKFLAENTLKKLIETPKSLGHFAGGAQLKLVGQKMTIDITDEALKELIASYVRKDFRSLFFKSKKDKDKE
jgi:V/A-type H+-transporting ATPase subunit E